jgi:hypothetical protein
VPQSAPHLREGRAWALILRDRDCRGFAPSFLPAADRVLARSPPPGAGAWGPRGPRGASHPRRPPTLPLKLRSRARRGAVTRGGRGRLPPPGAWSARGPEPAARRGDSVCSARARTRLAGSARGRRMLAGFPGLGPRSRRGRPQARP